MNFLMPNFSNNNNNNQMQNAKVKKVNGTPIQKVIFVLMIIFTLPWSLIYLFVCSGRCVNCTKRILFNKRVCKKCLTRSQAIVDDFDAKIETFYAQLLTFDNIEEIFDQYGYILDRIDEITTIYDALDEEVDYMSMKSKVVDRLEANVEVWFKNQSVQFSKNLAYRKNVLTFLSTEGKEHVEFTEIANDLVERIEEIQTEE